MPTISRFQIPVDNIERARSFYAELFEWEFKDSSIEPWPIVTKNGREESLAASLLRREKKKQTIINYIGVPSVDHYENRVRMLGGRVVVPKKPILGKGYYSMCYDTESNLFALWEDDEYAH
ncbi:MAG: VOC family protein [bacterium]